MLGEGCVGDQIGEGLVAYSGIFGVAKEAGVKVGRDVLEQGAFALLQNNVGAVCQAVDLADKLMDVGSLVGRIVHHLAEFPSGFGGLIIVEVDRG